MDHLHSVELVLFPRLMSYVDFKWVCLICHFRHTCTVVRALRLSKA